MEYQRLSPKTSFIATGFAVVLFLLLIPAEYLFRAKLAFKEGYSLSQMQKWETHSLTEFSKLVSRSGTHYFLLIVLPFIFNIIDSVVAIKICIVSTHVLYVYSLVAVLFTEPRPYWIDTAVKGLNCDDGYGFPSEGILFGFTFYLGIILETVDGHRTTLRKVLYTALGIWVILISFCEMYLGENWPHQIGVTAAIGYLYMIINLNLNTYISRISIISTYYNQKNRRIKIYWFISTLGLLLIINTLSANIQDFNSTSIKWIKNAYKHCHFSNDIGGSYSYNQSAWIFFNLGAIFGSHLSSGRLANHWWKTNYAFRVIRGVLSAAACYGLFFLFNLIETYDNPTTYGLNYAIPGYICGYLTFGVLPLVFQKIKLNRVDNSVRFINSSGISLREVDSPY